MDREGFRQYLQGRKFPEDKVEQFIGGVDKFESFLAGAGRPAALTAPTANDVRAYADLLIKEKLNTLDNFRALILYGRFTRNRELFVAVVGLLDGAEVLENLYGKLARAAGEQTRDAVFQGIELPPLGAPSAEKPRLMRTVMERMEAMVDAATCREILSGSLRTLENVWYLEGREKYLACGSLDAFLEQRGQEFIAELERLKQAGELYFTQEVTDEVIEFVRNTPEIRQGVREGNILYEVKIPYMAKQYLAETDERMKRYYYCHCPWAREALRTGDAPVSPTFCYCSVGFVKKPWEVIFDQPLQGEMVESVLQGDMWCKIAIHLPEQVR